MEVVLKPTDKSIKAGTETGLAFAFMRMLPIRFRYLHLHSILCCSLDYMK